MNLKEWRENHIAGLKKGTRPIVREELEAFIQKFEAMQIPEQEADFSETENLYRAMNRYYGNPCDDTMEQVADLLVRCKLKKAAVIVPTYMLGERMDIERIASGTPGEWIPVYTSMEAARKWPREESELTVMSFDSITMLVVLHEEYDGIVFNPLADDRQLAFSRDELTKAEEECVPVRWENIRKKQV